MIKDSSLAFERGSLVKCDPDECYISYSQFVKWHPQYAIRWAYKARPSSEDIFTVLGVYNHVRKNRLDENKYCVVVRNKIKQIFLIGENGIKNAKEI